MGLGTSFGVYASTDVAAEDGEDTGIAFGGGRGLFGGGVSTIDTIDYVTIATPSGATDFGDLPVGRYGLAACSDGTKGVWAGGSGNTNTIDYVTIASPSNATDFGDLTVGRYGLAACSGD